MCFAVFIDPLLTTLCVRTRAGGCTHAYCLLLTSSFRRPCANIHTYIHTYVHMVCMYACMHVLPGVVRRTGKTHFVPPELNIFPPVVRSFVRCPGRCVRPSVRSFICSCVVRVCVCAATVQVLLWWCGREHNPNVHVVQTYRTCVRTRGRTFICPILVDCADRKNRHCIIRLVVACSLVVVLTVDWLAGRLTVGGLKMH